MLRNVGGAQPGDIERSTLGAPGKFTTCFAEWEERSPWEPLHVERGFGRGRKRRDGVRTRGEARDRSPIRPRAPHVRCAEASGWRSRRARHAKQHGSGEILLDRFARACRHHLAAKVVKAQVRAPSGSDRAVGTRVDSRRESGEGIPLSTGRAVTSWIRARTCAFVPTSRGRECRHARKEVEAQQDLAAAVLLGMPACFSAMPRLPGQRARRSRHVDRQSVASSSSPNTVTTFSSLPKPRWTCNGSHGLRSSHSAI